MRIFCPQDMPWTHTHTHRHTHTHIPSCRYFPALPKQCHLLMYSDNWTTTLNFTVCVCVCVWERECLCVSSYSFVLFVCASVCRWLIRAVSLAMSAQRWCMRATSTKATHVTNTPTYCTRRHTHTHTHTHIQLHSELAPAVHFMGIINEQLLIE